MIFLENIVKIYKNADSETLALQGLDLNIKKGEMVAVMGASGSGKSTLLNIIGCLEKADAGNLIIDGTDVSKLSNYEISEFQRKKLGYIWQNSARNLIPYLTSRENVLAPMRIAGKVDTKRAEELLISVGLKGKINSTLYTLSGGETQRVAIAVALANDPDIILADEPTGSVDFKTCDSIMELLKKINREQNKTIVIVTHDLHLSSKVQRVIYIRDGKTSSELIKVQEGSNVFNTHTEYSLIDKNRRIQIPEHILNASQIKGNLVSFSVENGNIVIKNGSR